MEIKLNEVEVQKLNLQPGEVLVVKVKSDEVTMASLEGLAEGLRSYFPNNKVSVLGIGENGAIDLTVVKESGNNNTCVDCACARRKVTPTPLTEEELADVKANDTDLQDKTNNEGNT